MKKSKPKKKCTPEELEKACKELCGCGSGKKWSECCGRCKVPC